MARFVPNVLTARVLGLLGIPAASFNARLPAMMRVGMRRLAQLQRASGAWGWFDRDGDNPLMTALAVEGLQHCQRLGYPVDRVVLSRGKKRLAEMAVGMTDLDRLALAGHVLGKPFPRLRDARKLSAYAQALWVLTLKGAGQPTRAAVERLIAQARTDHWEADLGEYRWGKVDVEATAYAIRALSRTRPGHPLIAKAVSWLLAQRRGNRWRSTKDTAIAIATLLEVIDLRRLARAAGASREAGQRRPALWRRFRVTLGAQSRTVKVDLNNPLDGALALDFDRLRPGRTRLRVAPLDGKAGVRFTAELGWRVWQDEGDERARGAGLQVAVGYSRPLERLRVGQEVDVTVTVSADATREYLTVSVPIPAGAEVIRGSGGGRFARFEARHERALFFLRELPGKQARVLRFKLRCRNAGGYRVLQPSVEQMYDEELRTTGRGRRVVIGS